MFFFFKKSGKSKKTQDVKNAHGVRGPILTRRTSVRQTRPALPENSPTYKRDGHHVIVGVSNGKLHRDFVSSHDAKRVSNTAY